MWVNSNAEAGLERKPQVRSHLRHEPSGNARILTLAINPTESSVIQTRLWSKRKVSLVSLRDFISNELAQLFYKSLEIF